jgi:hypothetical protein
VVGDHRLRELLDFGIGRLGRRELAGIDVDLVGGDDDLGNLRIVDAWATPRSAAAGNRRGRERKTSLTLLEYGDVFG